MAKTRVILVPSCDKHCPFWQLYFGVRGKLCYSCRIKLNNEYQPIVKTFPRDCPLKTLPEPTEHKENNES